MTSDLRPHTAAAPAPWPVRPAAERLPEAASRYTLPSIPYLRLRCTLRALDHARLPAYKGSLLRGAFGHALRRAVCAFGPQQACASCRLRRACVYTGLFETFIEDEPPPFLRGLPTSPRPYIFEPRGQDRDLPPGSALDFDLLLIGQAVDHQAYALLALERMAAGGLGRERYRFEFEQARTLGADGEWREADPRRPATPLMAGATIARAAADSTPASANREAAALAEASETPHPAGSAVAQDIPPAQATLHFLTPTRIKIRDRLAPSIGPRPLVFAMLRRILELAHFHVPGAQLDWSFHPLLDHASAIRVQAADLRWHDWQRYSNRQQTKMFLGGFVGNLHLAGDLAPLWRLLRAAEVLHVGKGATFGLGKFAIGAPS
jgi:hypothetical protein